MDTPSPTGPATPPRPSPVMGLALTGIHLHRFGLNMSPLSPLRAVDEESNSTTNSSSTTNNNNTEDNRDVLIDRLNDLVRHLSSSSSSHHGQDANAMSALHAHVDEMEAILARQDHKNHHHHHHHHRKHRRQSSTLTDIAKITPMSMVEAAEKNPQKSEATAVEESLPQPTTSDPALDVVAAECDTLADDLSSVLTNLTKRYHESEHIIRTLRHHVAAAQTTQTIQHDRHDELESELAFLRLQLRSIEVRCRPYLPVDADPALAASIENWKTDWAALRAKLADERTQLEGETKRLLLEV